ncbi:MAG: cysteine desulfurase family protein [bacterium]
MTGGGSGKRFVYLDHSATTPVDPRVAEVVHRAMVEGWGNPSSRYEKGNEAKLILDEARQRIAELLGVQPDELFFTSGGTEADNLALLGAMEVLRQKGRNHLVVSTLEHSAILLAAEYLRDEGFDVTFLKVGSDGVVDPSDLRKAMKKTTALVSVMHVNNEIGTIQPVAELAEVAHKAGALFHTDGVQSYGKLPLPVSEIGADLASISSHKIYGPKGVGALFVRKGVELVPRSWGGKQERGIRTGTENMPGIAGFAEASRICAHVMSEDAERIGALQEEFHRQVVDACDGDVFLNGSADQRIYLNLNLRFEGVEGESLLLALDLDGIAVSTGSACSSGSTKPSHVLIAIGMSQQAAHESLRLTLGRSNTGEDLTWVASRIGYHVKRLRAMAF